MKRRKLLSHLRAHGCELVREGGSHSWWGNQQQVPSRRFHDIQKSVIFCAVRSAMIWVWRNPELQETGITSLFAHHQHIHRFSLKSGATVTRRSLMMRYGSTSPAQVSLWIAKPCGEFFAKSLIRSVEHTTWVDGPRHKPKPAAECRRFLLAELRLSRRSYI